MNDGPRWRTGRSVGRTIYIQEGDKPSKSDALIGVMDTPELAQFMTDCVNWVLDHGVDLGGPWRGKK